VSYCIQTDILEQLDEDTLIELTDDTGTGCVDTSAVTRAIADADAEIDGYCAVRYDVPFSTVPVMIRKISVDIAVYNLFSRRGAVPEERDKRYANALKFLTNVAKGIISLGGDAPAQADDGGPEATAKKADRIFTVGRDSDRSTGTLDNY